MKSIKKMNNKNLKKNYQLKKVYYLLMINTSQKEKTNQLKHKNLLYNNWKSNKKSNKKWSKKKN